MAGAPQPDIPVPGGLLLRPWRLADADALLAAWRDPAIRRWNRPAAGGAEEARAKIAQFEQRWHDEEWASWAIARAENDTVVGFIAVADLHLRAGHGEIVYWVLPSARGQGVALRATESVTEWAFGKLGLHRVELTHSVANAASCRVAEKAGFRLEGIKTSAALHADGWHDMHLHARIRDDGVLNSSKDVHPSAA